jgi:UDP-2,4-diacetamido-2,4,6-trideoxy-beta-L-altropyranose hydrolase
MRIVFRVDASTRIGTGHVVRCATLGHALRKQGSEVIFICASLPGNCCESLERDGFQVERIQVPRMADSGADDMTEREIGEVGALLRKLGRPDWLVVDHYSLDARWEAAMRPFCGRILVIDDLANRRHECDALLDQNLVADLDVRYQDKLPAGCKTMLGPRFALLQPLYRELRKRVRARSGSPRRILVFFGGADADNLTGRVLGVLRRIGEGEVRIDVVAGASNPHKLKLLQEVAAIPGARFHDALPTLAEFMLEADIAIGACGTTTWERCCLGLPALVVTVAENQVEIARELHARTVIRWIGRADATDEGRVAAELDAVFREGLDPAWSYRCQELVDGFGTERVATFLAAGARMPLLVRNAAGSDERLLLDWANDQLVRHYSFSSTVIDADDHRRWFSDRLADRENCRIYIAEATSGVPVGQVRFERRNGEWRIGYSLDALFRGAGLGKRLLALAIERHVEDCPGAIIVGTVKGANGASHSVFRTLGFAAREPVDGSTEYRWTAAHAATPGEMVGSDRPAGYQ